MVWRALYPPLMHFAIGQVIAALALLLFSPEDPYYSMAMVLTGVTGLLTLIPAAFLYRRDRRCRVAGGLIPEKKKRLTIWEILLLLAAGAALSQYANLLVGLLMMGSQSGMEYRDTMDQITQGKALWEMVLWMGIVAPVAEEAVFRWLVYLRMRDHMRVPAAALLSGVFFGIYHGNLLQGLYASLMGAAFALLLEWSGSLASCALLHIGANVWSLILNEKSSWFMEDQGLLVLGTIMILYLLCLAFTFSYFREVSRRRKNRRFV